MEQLTHLKSAIGGLCMRLMFYTARIPSSEAWGAGIWLFACTWVGREFQLSWKSWSFLDSCGACQKKHRALSFGWIGSESCDRAFLLCRIAASPQRRSTQLESFSRSSISTTVRVGACERNTVKKERSPKKGGPKHVRLCFG